jgi:hypothetical protein
MGFGKALLPVGRLSTEMKQITAVAVAHVTQRPYCINTLGAGATSDD